jgi:hypothetical protein
MITKLNKEELEFVFERALEIDRRRKEEAEKFAKEAGRNKPNKEDYKKAYQLSEKIWCEVDSDFTLKLLKTIEEKYKKSVRGRLLFIYFQFLGVITHQTPEEVTPFKSELDFFFQKEKLKRISWRNFSETNRVSPLITRYSPILFNRFLMGYSSPYSISNSIDKSISSFEDSNNRNPISYEGGTLFLKFNPYFSSEVRNNGFYLNLEKSGYSSVWDNQSDYVEIDYPMSKSHSTSSVCPSKISTWLASTFEDESNSLCKYSGLRRLGPDKENSFFNSNLSPMSLDLKVK